MDKEIKKHLKIIYDELSKIKLIQIDIGERLLKLEGKKVFKGDS